MHFFKSWSALATLYTAYFATITLIHLRPTLRNALDDTGLQIEKKQNNSVDSSSSSSSSNCSSNGSSSSNSSSNSSSSSYSFVDPTTFYTIYSQE